MKSYREYEYANIVKLTKEDYELNDDSRFNIRCTHFSYAIGKTTIGKDGVMVFKDLLTQDETSYPLFTSILEAQENCASGQLKIDEAFAINASPVTDIISIDAFTTREELIKKLKETRLKFTFMRDFPNQAPVLKKEMSKKGSYEESFR